MTHVVIDLYIEFAEQVTGLVVPYPPHIVGNLVQTFQFFGQCCLYGQHLPLRLIGVVYFYLHHLFYLVIE